MLSGLKAHDQHKSPSLDYYNVTGSCLCVILSSILIVSWDLATPEQWLK